jgi:tetratricopeptide (TPR) repeat protein
MKTDLFLRPIRKLGRITLVQVLTVFLLAAASTGFAQTNESVADANSSYKAAWKFQKLAEGAVSTNEAKTNFHQAIAQCDAATKVQQSFFGAHALAAHCYYRLAQMEPALQPHHDLIETARARFAVAARCPGVTAALHDEWGNMLLQEVTASETPAERHKLLLEARQIFESGLKLTDFSGQHASVQRDLGICLTLLAESTGDATEKRTIYEEAIRHFTAAAKVDAVGNTPQLHAHWGVALVEYSKLMNDRMMLRDAIEQLGTALEKGAQGMEVHYNLACAYALLEEPDNAMRHLRICVDNDDAKRTYYNAAVQDPDFWSLRRTRDYNELIASRQPPPIAPVTPSLSNR